ncbi:hypothetical protein JTB14_038461 [Gonioctena quinquepunctata]|nr:hypothetical protein JTB14_038461 [Gonioctena quinquepunctata]
MSIQDRDKKVRSLRFYINCLKKRNHSKVCKQGLCVIRSTSNANNESVPEAFTIDNSVESGVTVMSACGTIDHVFLSTNSRSKWICANSSSISRQ